VGRPGMTVVTSAATLITMRRVILIAIAFGIPLLWALAPYGRTVDMMGTGEPRTFASTTLRLAQEASRSDSRELVPILPILFLGLLSPLYPALVGTLLLTVPRWFATRRRWVWIVEGIVGLLLSPVGLVVAYLDLLVLVPGASDPVPYVPLWLLTGCAALGGIAAIMIGVAPHGRIARTVLGQPAPR
jgi:hypothetical protein